MYGAVPEAPLYARWCSIDTSERKMYRCLLGISAIKLARPCMRNASSENSIAERE